MAAFRGRLHECVTGGFWAGYLQAFDLTGASARRSLGGYERSDQDALASDWRRVGGAIGAAMNRYDKAGVYDTGRPGEYD